MSVPQDLEKIDNTLITLRKTFNNNATKIIEFRIEQLENLLKGVKEMQDELKDALFKDLGKGELAAHIEAIMTLEEGIKFTIKNLKTWAQPKVVDTPLSLSPSWSTIQYDPLGVVLIMGAWNYPIFTTLGPLIDAIAAGNCVVLKPSEMAPASSNAMKKLINKYLDNYCYQVLEGDHLVSQQLTQQKFDLIVFTGSTDKGKLVAQAAAKNLVPCILELGGKSPCIVDETADVDLAAQKIVAAKIMNSGQICIAPDFVLVHASKQQELLNALEKYIKEFQLKDNDSQGLGRMVNINHFRRVIALLDEKDHKGQVIGPKIHDEQKLYISPTVVVKPDLNSQIMKEEIFGPLIPVLQFQQIGQVIEFINQRDKPLAIYYFGNATRNQNKEQIQIQTQSGAFVVNEVILQVSSHYLPFGGVGTSGYGRYHGLEGFKQFSNQKSVLLRPAVNNKFTKVLNPPFNLQKSQQIKNLAQQVSGLTQFKVLRHIGIGLGIVTVLRTLKNQYLKKTEPKL